MQETDKKQSKITTTTSQNVNNEKQMRKQNMILVPVRVGKLGWKS